VLRRRALVLLLALTAVAAVGVATPTTALAGGEATVHVEVVRGFKGKTGVDPKIERHTRLLSGVEGYGDWSGVTSFAMKLELGEEKQKKVGGRAFAAKLDKLTADKAGVTMRVFDPRGKEHKVVGKFAPGAQSAVQTKSADGAESWIFIVVVDF
jgi:hypothetical protein